MSAKNLREENILFWAQAVTVAVQPSYQYSINFRLPWVTTQFYWNRVQVMSELYRLPDLLPEPVPVYCAIEDANQPAEFAGALQPSVLSTSFDVVNPGFVQIFATDRNDFVGPLVGAKGLEYSATLSLFPASPAAVGDSFDVLLRLSLLIEYS